MSSLDQKPGKWRWKFAFIPIDLEDGGKPIWFRWYQERVLAVYSSGSKYEVRRDPDQPSYVMNDSNPVI